jgi:hypothetical protein
MSASTAKILFAHSSGDDARIPMECVPVIFGCAFAEKYPVIRGSAIAEIKLCRRHSSMP